MFNTSSVQSYKYNLCLDYYSFLPLLELSVCTASRAELSKTLKELSLTAIIRRRELIALHEINWINAINCIEIKMCNYRFKIIAFTIKIWNYPLRIIALTNAIKDQTKIILQCCNYLKIDNFPSPSWVTLTIIESIQ